VAAEAAPSPQESKKSGKIVIAPEDHSKGYDSALNHVDRRDVLEFVGLAAETEPVPEAGAYTFNSDFAGMLKEGDKAVSGHNIELESQISKVDLARFASQNAYYSERCQCDFLTYIITWKEPLLTEYNSECLIFKPKIKQLHKIDDKAAIKKLEEKAAAGERINQLEVVFLPITGTEVPPIDKAFKACDLAALAESDLEKRKKLGSAIMLASNRVLSGEEKGELRK
jgi:hypothetical protein